jgi:hypothetical protein
MTIPKPWLRSWLQVSPKSGSTRPSPYGSIGIVNDRGKRFGARC